MVFTRELVTLVLTNKNGTFKFWHPIDLDNETHRQLIINFRRSGYIVTINRQLGF